MGQSSLALRIIALVAERDRIGTGDVVRELGVSRSAAYRALRVLEQQGYLMLAQSGRGYGVGPALVRLAESPAIETASRRRWIPVLGDVRDETGETVHVAALVGSQVLVVDGRRSAQEHDMGSRIGMTAPANSMAAGKLLLAALDDRLILSMIPSPRLPLRTSRTIGETDELLGEVGRIRDDGYACAIEESEAGIDSIAVPLDGSTFRDRVALVVSVPTERGGVRRLRRLGAVSATVIAEAAKRGQVSPWACRRPSASVGRPSSGTL